MELLSDLAYYGLTTFSGNCRAVCKLTSCLNCSVNPGFDFIFFFPSAGYQTLGEEYVNIVQVDPTKRQIPSRARRGLFVLCHAFLPYLLEKVLVCLENELEGDQDTSVGIRRRQAASGWWSLEWWLRRWVRKAVGLLTEPQRRACLPAVFVIKQGVTLLNRLHVALFYISSSFYHLSNRAAGISYVSHLTFVSKQKKQSST